MRILGVDPGLKITGYGLIDANEGQDSKIKLIEAGIIEPKPKDLLQDKLSKVYEILDEIIVQFSPQIMVLEKLYAHYNHPTTACILGHLRGVICLLCADRKLILAEHSVKRIRKAIVGQGGANKLQTQRIVAHLLKINEEDLTADASDALALAIGYVQQLRFKVG